VQVWWITFIYTFFEKDQKYTEKPQTLIPDNADGIISLIHSRPIGWRYGGHCSPQAEISIYLGVPITVLGDMAGVWWSS